MILFNCVPFQMGTSLKAKNLLPGGANSFLYEQFLIVREITFITLIKPPLNVTFIITHMRNLRNGCYANDNQTVYLNVTYSYCIYRVFNNK